MNHKSYGRAALVAALISFSVWAGCGAGVEGTYSNATGLAMVDLKSGGKATVTMLGQTTECTYKADSKQVEMNCGGDKSVFRINGDGSLTGPGFIGVLKKAK